MKSHKSLYIVVLLLLVSQFTFGQWNLINNLTQKDFRDVDYLSPNEIILSGLGGIIRTEDGGKTWTSGEMINTIGQNLIGSLPENLQFYDANTVFMGGMMWGHNIAMVMKSLDNGKTWSSRFSQEYGGWPRTVQKYDWLGDAVYACGTNGLFLKSSDKGESWSDLSLNISKELRSLAVLTENAVLGVYDEKIIKTVDGGATWSTLLNREGEAFKDIKILSPTTYLALSEERFFISKDAGATWENTISLLGFPGFKRIDVSPNGDIYVSSYGQLYRSENGFDWGIEDLPAGDYVGVDFTDANNIIAAKSNGVVYKTTNGPHTKPNVEIITDKSNFCIDSTYHFKSGAGFATSIAWYINDSLVGTNSDLTYVFNEGSQADTLKVVAVGVNSNATAIKIINIEADLEYVVEYEFYEGVQCPRVFGAIEITNPLDNVNYYLKDYGKDDYRSMVKGNDFEVKLETGEILPSDKLYIEAQIENSCGSKTNVTNVDLVFEPKLPKVDWKLSESEFYRSITSLDVVNERSIYSVTLDGEIIQSTDGGRTYDVITDVRNQVTSSSSVSVRGYDFFNDSLWVFGGSSIYITRDRGATFEVKQERIHSVHGIKVIDDQTFLAWGENKSNNLIILKTNDGGANWYMVHNYETTYTSAWGNIKRVAGDTLIATVVNRFNTDSTNKSDEFIYSYDLGDTWAHDNVYRTGGLKNPQYFGTKTRFGFRNEYIYKTIDGGETWIKRPLSYKENNFGVQGFHMITPERGYAIASAYNEVWNSSTSKWGRYEGYVFKTVDGGNCWQLVSHLKYDPKHITFIGDSIGLISGQEGKERVYYDGRLWRLNDGLFPTFTSNFAYGCLEDTFKFANTSAAFDRFEWFSNGELFSSATNAELTGIPVGDYKIQLVGYDGVRVDTSNAFSFTVYPPSTITTTKTLDRVRTEYCSTLISTNGGISMAAEGIGIGYRWETDLGNGFETIKTGSWLSLNDLPKHISNYPLRSVVSGTCAEDGIVGPINIQIVELPKFYDVPMGDTVCEGETARLLPQVEGGDLSFEWQRVVSEGSYARLYEDDHFLNVNSDSLIGVNIDSGIHGKQYALEASNACGARTSAPITIHMGEDAKITDQPDNYLGCSSENAFFVVEVDGLNPQFQWELDSGSGYFSLENNEIINGAQTNTLVFNNISKFNQAQLRCIVSSGCAASLISSSAIITHTASVQIDSVRTKFCNPATSVWAGIVYTGGNGTQFSWQVDTGNGYAVIPNNVSNDVWLNFTPGLDGGAFKYTYLDCGIIEESQAIPIQLTDVPELVTDLPAKIAYCRDDSLILEVESSAPGSSYRWSKKLNYYGFRNMVDDENVSGTKTSKLVLAPGQEGEYQVLVSKNRCSKISNIVEVEENIPVILRDFEDDFICRNTNEVTLDIQTYARDSIFWSTNGDGIFSNYHDINTVYNLGGNDNFQDSIVIKLLITSYSDYCPDLLDSISVFRDFCVGQNELYEISQIQVFLNSTNNVLNIQSDFLIGLVEIFDVNGKEVLSVYNQAKFDISTFKMGLYFVNAFGLNGEKLGTAKILKK